MGNSPLGTDLWVWWSLHAAPWASPQVAVQVPSKRGPLGWAPSPWPGRLCEHCCGPGSPGHVSKPRASYLEGSGRVPLRGCCEKPTPRGGEWRGICLWGAPGSSLSPPAGAWTCGSASQLWRALRQARRLRARPSAWRAARTGYLGSRTPPLRSAVCGSGLRGSATRTCAPRRTATSVSCALEVRGRGGGAGGLGTAFCPEPGQLTPRNCLTATLGPLLPLARTVPLPPPAPFLADQCLGVC